MEFQARQGDVFFEVVSELPKGLKKYNSPVMAQGEVTGHAHRITSPNVAVLDSFIAENGDIFVRSEDESIQVGHEEHGTIDLPAESWIKVTRQREFDPIAAEKERKVRD